MKFSGVPIGPLPQWVAFNRMVRVLPTPIDFRISVLAHGHGAHTQVGRGGAGPRSGSRH